jgi:hypothetical protein
MGMSTAELIENLTTRLATLEATQDSPPEVDSGSYTPTLTNMDVGTGGSADNSARYTYAHGILNCSGTIVFGTSGTTFPGGSNEKIGLPSGFTITSGFGASIPVGATRLRTSSNRVGMLYASGGDTWVEPINLDASTTYVISSIRWQCTVPASRS